MIHFNSSRVIKKGVFYYEVKEHALLINEIPKHTHTRGSMNITGKILSFASVNGAFTGESFSKYVAASTSPNTLEVGWGNFTASRTWTGESSNAQTPGDSSKQANGDAHNHGFKTSTNNGSSWTDSDSIEINNPKYVGIYAYKRTA